MRLGLKFWPDKLMAKFAHFVKGIAFFGRTSSLLAGWAHRPDGLSNPLSPFGLDELGGPELVRPLDGLTLDRTGSVQAGRAQIWPDRLIQEAARSQARWVQAGYLQIFP